MAVFTKVTQLIIQVKRKTNALRNFLKGDNGRFFLSYYRQVYMTWVTHIAQDWDVLSGTKILTGLPLKLQGVL